MNIIWKIFLIKNNNYVSYFLGTVTIDISIKKIKLTIPQKTEPNKINERVSMKLLLSSLLKKKGVCSVWSIKHKKHRIIKPVIKPLL